MFMLDTNIVIHLRDGDPATTKAVGALKEPILLSMITRVELEGGVYRESDLVAIRRARLDAILAALPVVAFDDAAADAYRGIVAAAGYSRRKLLDRMIAAQAIVHRAALVTRNGEDFKDIPSLRLELW
jgi:predicted nucleic acid-binding protein